MSFLNKVKIISISEKGDAAILQHYTEYIKQNRLKKIMLEKQIGFHQEINARKPYILTVWATSGKPFSMVKANHFIEEVTLTLADNGAKHDEDYIFEVIEHE